MRSSLFHTTLLSRQCSSEPVPRLTGAHDSQLAVTNRVLVRHRSRPVYGSHTVNSVRALSSCVSRETLLRNSYNIMWARAFILTLLTINMSLSQSLYWCTDSIAKSA